ncbi:hypothetical protein E5288_WYG012669 [Bos mutus]|uniref:Secreted protein n=1 Tax=Bos mutus TaxID=72004 RepID=A0A6B0QUB8_9CETA|nr:hypothetical protein [Bos mutus]
MVIPAVEIVRVLMVLTLARAMELRCGPGGEDHSQEDFTGKDRKLSSSSILLRISTLQLFRAKFHKLGCGIVVMQKQSQKA